VEIRVASSLDHQSRLWRAVEARMPQRLAKMQSSK
jgi:hypothetical protein